MVNRNNKFTRSTKAIEHLQTGYPDIWKLWFEECEALKSRILGNEKAIKEHVKNKAKNGLRIYLEIQNILSADYYLPEYYHPKDNPRDIKVDLEPLGTGFKQIYDILDEFEMKGELPKNATIRNYQEIINTIIQDKSLYEMFKKPKETKNRLTERINEYNGGLRK